MRDMHLWTYWTVKAFVECNCGFSKKVADAAEAQAVHEAHETAMEAEWQASLKTETKLLVVEEPTSDPRFNKEMINIGINKAIDEKTEMLFNQA